MIVYNKKIKELCVLISDKFKDWISNSNGLATISRYKLWYSSSTIYLRIILNFTVNIYLLILYYELRDQILSLYIYLILII